jgi:signal transduction histidine kinase
MYGLGENEAWRPEDYWRRLHPKDRERAEDIWLRGIAQCKPYEYVARYVPTGGGTRVHLVRGMPFRGPDGRTARAIGVVQDITDQTEAEEKLHRLSQELLHARDEGDRRTAHALHAGAGQSLAALKMTLGALREELRNPNEASTQLLESAIQLADEAVRDVRTTSYSMHPHMLDEAGLGPALRCYAEGFARRSGIAVRLEVADDFGRLPRKIETGVFRIVQEALTNVHRYSGSRNATIRLCRENGNIRAEVRDEGCGIVSAAPGMKWRSPAGVGIPGMRERTKQLNGVFELETEPGRGTTVRCVVPAHRENHGAPLRVETSKT